MKLFFNRGVTLAVSLVILTSLSACVSRQREKVTAVAVPKGPIEISSASCGELQDAFISAFGSSKAIPTAEDLASELAARCGVKLSGKTTADPNLKIITHQYGG